MAREKRVRISSTLTKRAAVEEAWGVALMTKQKGWGSWDGRAAGGAAGICSMFCAVMTLVKR
ncbi:nuclease SbcCD subunit C [Comamonas sp. E6]|nr:nuclease SbcCD subunit C [Comamonas sp. E6]